MVSLEQYTCQINVPEIGTKGQQQLTKAKILIVGAGGLGCVNALYLASSGIGTIGIMDHDSIELSNLSRQVLYGINDVGKKKSITAVYKLKKINSNISLVAIDKQLPIENAQKIIKKYDLVVD